MEEYDYLIVGAGLFGAVFACEMTKKGKRCLVIDKREHLGGNVYCKEIKGIQVHQYGPHIFHTNDKDIWNYVNQFAEFNHFIYSPVANYKGKLYSLPFNMNTFYQLWGVTTPTEAQQVIEKQIKESGITSPKNLEEQALSLVGKDVYETLIKGYTEKQWGRPATELPSFIIKRLPLRYIFDNNYFNDRYQGIPIGGYNVIIENMLKGIETKIGVDYLKNKSYYDNIANTVVYTGKIDEYFGYCFGELEYRSLRFETEVLEMENFQGCAGMNYTDAETPYTRIVEHKHFEFGKQKHTVITKEYSQNWDREKEAYYPINNTANQELYNKYKEKASTLINVIFGGRLAEYRYYDMHQVIASALQRVKTINS